LKPRELLYLDGTEPPHSNVIDGGIRRWREAIAEQKLAAETTKIRHAKLVELMAEAGLERYPYVDAESGKRKILVVQKEPKAKQKAAPGAKKQRRDAESSAASARLRRTRIRSL
jgi:hypothetical protein